MSSYDAQITELRTRITAAERVRARAEAQHETARALADRARERLREEFDVDTLDAARALLTDLETALEQEITTLRGHLDEMGV